MRTIVITLTTVTIGFVAWVALSPRSDARARAESKHGIELPISATNVQCRASRGFLDQGVATLFEMTATDLASFVSRLRINSRSTPAKSSGDPTVNGYNVWPSGSSTFVPSNERYGGWRRTWHGEAVPIEMLSCSSPKGDWLHVELWRLQDGRMLVKMYTDWT
jgi:hypothetical protein